MNTIQAESVVRDLAEQDAGFEEDIDGHVKYTGSNAAQMIEIWHTEAGQVGDSGTIEAINLLGKTRAAEIYAAARA